MCVVYVFVPVGVIVFALTVCGCVFMSGYGMFVSSVYGGCLRLLCVVVFMSAVCGMCVCACCVLWVFVFAVWLLFVPSVCGLCLCLLCSLCVRPVGG